MGDYDVVVLAGGRGQRLGGASKPDLRGPDGRSLLLTTLYAAAQLSPRRTVVVGPPALAATVQQAPPALGEVHLVQEVPPFSGPAAALAAGVTALGDAPSTWVLTLTCDVPGVAAAVAVLSTAVEQVGPGRLGDVAGVVGTDGDGHRQVLTAAYRSTALAGALAEAAGRSSGLTGASARSAVASLALLEVPLPSEATDDVDTWADARRLGVGTLEGHAPH